MRYVTVLAILSLPLGAQSVEAERQTMQALLVEVQQLRFAIERSTLLGTRTQIAMQRMQMQEARASRLSQELDLVQKEISDIQAKAPHSAARVKNLEDGIHQFNDPAQRKAVEAEINREKLLLEQLSAQEQQRRAREAELANQLRAEQSRVNELQDRINQMERALDAAIAQITNGR